MFNKKIDIKNNVIRKNIISKLGKKSGENIYSSDLKLIDELYLNGLSIAGKKQIENLDDIVKLKYIKKLSLKNIDISTKYSRIIESKHLKTLEIYTCEIQSAKLCIKKLILDTVDAKNINIKKASIVILNQVANFDFNALTKVNGLEQLYISNMNIENVEWINKLKKLKQIVFSECKEVDVKKISPRDGLTIEVNAKDIMLDKK